MTKKETHYRLCRRMMYILLLPMLLAGLFFMTAKEVRAEEENVSTAKGVWTWQRWSTPGQEAETDNYTFARCINTKTGEYLADGWHVVDGYRYYFNVHGYASDQYHEGYFVGDYMSQGVFADDEEQDPFAWVQDENGWRYENEEGDYLFSTRVWIDGRIYIFDEEGYLLKNGWYQDPDSGKWYYVVPSGACAMGWIKLGAKWWFFDRTDGHMAEKGGYDTREPFARKPQNYVFISNGSLKSTYGWQLGADEKWYFSLGNGVAVVGWRVVGGTEYYFESGLRGQMAASTDWEWYQNGYYLMEDGTKSTSKYGWHATEDGRWWYGNSRYYVSDDLVYINGWSYEFTEDGYCSYGWCLATGDEVFYKTELYTQEELYLLAAVVYCEVGAECWDAQLGVANVVLNRMAMDAYPDNMHDVVYQKNQFTVAGTAKFNKCLETGGSATALKAAEEALNGNNNCPGCIGFKLSKNVDKNDPKYTIYGTIAFF